MVKNRHFLRGQKSSKNRQFSDPKKMVKKWSKIDLFLGGQKIVKNRQKIVKNRDFWTPPKSIKIGVSIATARKKWSKNGHFCDFRHPRCQKLGVFLGPDRVRKRSRSSPIDFEKSIFFEKNAFFQKSAFFDVFSTFWSDPYINPPGFGLFALLKRAGGRFRTPPGPSGFSEKPPAGRMDLFAGPLPA